MRSVSKLRKFWLEKSAVLNCRLEIFMSLVYSLGGGFYENSN